MISVVIPAYNRAEYLKDAIDGVIGQTYQDFEIIVVDDESKDNTKEVALAYKKKVKYIFQKNKERGAARNNGIAHAKGDYVAFLDSDDFWLPEHLENCLKALEKNKDAAISFSNSYIFDKKGSIVSKIKSEASYGLPLGKIVSNFSSFGCNASSCLVKKQIFEKVGCFNETRALSGSEDWEMWVRIAGVAKFIPTNVYTAMIRFHTGKSSINPDSMARSMKLALDIVYKNVNLLPRIRDLEKKAYSCMFTIAAINYYASGDCSTSRKYLKKAILVHPASVFDNKYIAYTFIRSLVGPKFSFYARKIKWTLHNYYIHNWKI